MVRLELTELPGRKPERLERRSEAESGTKRVHSVRSRVEMLNPDGSGIGFAKKLVRSIKIRTTSLDN